ncbi:beta-ketoacyl synthase N-terminal-like domain-containing protein, partial [Streptomyces sp. KLOTTS4A1]|uniref:acyl carrier protein n=1 Tax=Streptomyces sp. KLOTTS4A1 TaxID=3390996 RepID=UPI0039F529DC
TALRPSPLLADLPDTHPTSISTSTPHDGDGQIPAGSVWEERLRDLDDAEARTALREVVRSHAAAVLGHGDASVIALMTAFRDLGFDSLTAVELRNRLVKETGLELPATLVFDYPDAESLARHLVELLLDHREADGPLPTARLTPAHAHADPDADVDPIAIVGMSCRLPGDVRTPEALWQLVSDGLEGITGFPVDRGWEDVPLGDLDTAAGSSFARVGGFLHDAGSFDPEFFGISPREALAMDPQQRLVLEASWETVEGAGIAPATLRGSRTGVFVGGCSQGYGAGALAQGGEGVSGQLLTGTATSVLSGRLSYAFGFEGPAV